MVCVFPPFFFFFLSFFLLFIQLPSSETSSDFLLNRNKNRQRQTDGGRDIHRLRYGARERAGGGGGGGKEEEGGRRGGVMSCSKPISCLVLRQKLSAMQRVKHQPRK